MNLHNISKNKKVCRGTSNAVSKNSCHRNLKSHHSVKCQNSYLNICVYIYIYIYSHTCVYAHICDYAYTYSVRLLSHVQLFATPWIKARQASLSITNSRSLLKLMSIESVMPSSHLIFCHPLLLLHPLPPSIRVFSNESTLHEVAKVLVFQLQHQSFQWTPRTDLL